MLPPGRRLGAHLAIGDGMVRAADRAVEIGAAALQIFSDNPTAWRRRADPSPEIPAFRARLGGGGIAPLAIHASYLINLAAADPAHHERSVALLAAELRAARRLGATLVTVHIGSHGGTGVAAGIDRLVATVVRAFVAADEPELAAADDRPGGEAADTEPDAVGDPAESSPDLAAEPVTIMLENSAGAGFGLGTDLDELASIADALALAGVAEARVGFCFDTAHAWAAGLELSDPSATDAFLDGFDRRIGLSRLALVHFNDSRSGLGSRSDRHEHIGGGAIGEAGLAHVLRHARLAHATYILETPGMDDGYDVVNLARASALMRGERLAPLPPAAFSLSGSRARATAARVP